MAYLLKNSTQVVHTLEQTAQSIKDDVNFEFKRLGLRLSYDQWIVLSAIHNVEGQTQIQLARSCRKEPASICRTLKVLSRKGLISQYSVLSNKKSQRVKLTRKGIDLVLITSQSVEKVSKRCLESLFDRELNLFTSILDRIQASA